MPDDWNLILQYRDGPRDECRRYPDMPIADALQICLCADASAPSGLAARIHDELRMVFSAIAPTAAAHAVQCRGPQALDCLARRVADCRTVLVMVTGMTRIGRDLESQARQWPRGGPGEDVVLPILPAGADPAAVLPSPLDEHQILRDMGDARSLAADILRVAGLGGVHRRLFISYRRDDTRPLADQLFEGFSHAGFDVFLDRFCGTPGRLFPDELAEEIVDNGVVVVLESANLHRSPWTLAEISFAYLFQLGLLALNVDGAAGYGLIPGGDRHSIRTAPNGRLSANDLTGCIDFVRNAYAGQMVRRRLYLEALLRNGLANAAPPGAAVMEQGLFRVDAHRGSLSYFVAPAERAPSVGDVRRAQERAHSQGAHPVVFGPYPYLARGRYRDFEWILRVAAASAMSEGDVMRCCQSMINGAARL